MEALSTGARDSIERRRQEMLTRVLLHVFETTGPVDRAVNRARPQLAFDDMQDYAIVPVNHIDDLRSPECAHIERLTARRGIERGAIEDDGRAAVV